MLIVQQSWGGSTGSGSAFTPVSGGMNSWDRNNVTRPNNGFWIMLRNLSPMIDTETLRLICQQHGPLLHFSMFQGQAIIQYRTQEEAIKAQNKLNNCTLGNLRMSADFVSEQDIARISQNPGGGGGGSSMMPGNNPRMGLPRKDNTGLWNQSPSVGAYGSQYGNTGSSMWNSSGSSGGSVWASGDDHLIGNLLGGESM